MKYVSSLPQGHIHPVDTLINLSCNYQYARDFAAGSKRRLKSPCSQRHTVLNFTKQQSTLNTAFKQYVNKKITMFCDQRRSIVKYFVVRASQVFE